MNIMKVSSYPISDLEMVIMFVQIMCTKENILMAIDMDMVDIQILMDLGTKENGLLIIEKDKGSILTKKGKNMQVNGWKI